MMKNVLYIFLLFFISSVTLFADGRYVHVNRENYNLSCDLVRSIHRDSRGYIWIGTEMGLNRFDGVRMKQYKSDEYKLPSQYIFSISEDGKGMSQLIKINVADNVAVAIHDVEAGCSFETDSISLTTAAKIPAGHKVALRDMSEGEDVSKYGFPIGHLLKAIPQGGLIDHSVMKTNLEGLLEYSYQPDLTEIAPTSDKAFFKGYRRADGRAGIRNELWIIPTVGCVNGVAQSIQKQFEKELSNYPSIEKVIAFPHNYGCSQLGGDHENTRKILADMVHHPNAAGVLVVALGCENNQLSAFRELVGEVDETRVKFFESQKILGDEVEFGLNLLREIAATAKDDKREDIPVSELKVVLFTTGRGTPFGTFVPTAKISTNSTLAANKPLWIDFNAGEIVDGRPSEEVDASFVDFVLGVASGEQTNNEKSGYSEIAIFKSGVTL